ncbi:MAG: amino acid permease [Ferruginibacter sp.]
MTVAQTKLSFFDISIIVVSLVIGMGIFGTPAKVAASAGSSEIFFAAWFAGGIVALCGALTYAEIGLRLPVMGGYYKVFAECYHPAVGFTVNILILISNAASLGVVALIGADYVSDLLFGAPSGILFNVSLSIISVIIFYAVNFYGLKTSSRTQNVLMIIKIAAVIILAASVLKGVMITPHGYDTNALVYNFKDNNWLKLFLISMIPVCFSYGGYQQTINFGSEVKETKSLAKGIVAGLILVMLLYLAINYAYTKVIGFDEMKNASAVGALLCEVWFGKTGGKIFDLLMFLSVLGYVNIVLMSNPRVMYAMSEDGVLPKIFAYKHPKTLALLPGLTAIAVITIIITFIGKGIDNILGFTMFLDSIGMSFSAAALFILRKRKQNEAAVTSNIKNYMPLFTGFFVFAYFMIAIAVVISNWKAAATGLILLLIALGIYFLFYHKKKHV